MSRVVDYDLQVLKDLILKMGGFVERAIEEACLTVIKRDPSRLKKVYDYEDQINQLHLEVDEHCLRLLAKQAPVAKDLRFVISAIKINVDLERIGDQSVNIAYGGGQFLSSGLQYVAADLENMSVIVRQMVKQALDAFVDGDVELSRRVIERDDLVDHLNDQLYEELTKMMIKNPSQIAPCLDLVMIARNLERTADHATNVAEEVVFFITGDDVRHGQRGLSLV